jgi:DNA invertase Pin-like site-specific DNA recombinase
LPLRRHPRRHQAEPARPVVDRCAQHRRGADRGRVKLNIGGSVHDPTDPVGRLLLYVLDMIAEFGSDLIRMRTREGMKVAKAKAKGRLRGKQPKLKPAQEAHLVEMWRGGKHTSAELGELFSVARSTVYRAVQRAGEPTGVARSAHR